MLRSIDFVLVADLLAGGISTFMRRFLLGRKRLLALRILTARPMWWLAARCLAVSDAHRRYKQFGIRALEAWENLLLGDDKGKD